MSKSRWLGLRQWYGTGAKSVCYHRAGQWGRASAFLGPKYLQSGARWANACIQWIPSRTHSYSTQSNREPGVQVKKAPHFATITISNPTKLNIVNSTILSELTSVCNDLESDNDLRAVVITGGPTAPGKAPAFIGGADIKEMYQLSSAEEARSFILRIHGACQALRDLPVPVIAKVHGYSLGAGLEIMAACDLRIATKTSVFGMPEVKVGLPSVVEAALLPGLIGMGRTRRLLYLAENIDAVTAEGWGLVEKVVEDEMRLDQAVAEWVGILMEMSPQAIRSQKRLMQRWEECGVEGGIRAGVDAFADAFRDGGKEPREYMGRFVGGKR
jgi:enoyl-CoA hydratase/carnithine racemase